MTVYTVEVDGSPRDFGKATLNFTTDTKTMHTFSVALKDKDEVVTEGDSVDIKRDGTTIFSGIIETIGPDMTTNGIWKEISGRHIAVRIWGRWTERYADKPVGAWSDYYPNKIVEFLLYPSRSDRPSLIEEDTRVRVGWGIDPASWVVTASSEASGFEAELVKDRRHHFGWKSSGSNQNGEYITIDMGASYTICGIRIENKYTEEYIRGYTIKTSATGVFGGEEVTVATETWNKGRNIVESWTPAATRYVRITCTRATTDPVFIGEIFIFEATDAISGISVGTLTEHLPLNDSLIIGTASGSSITVEDGWKFNARDEILVEDSGGYETAEVLSVSGDVLTLTGALTGSYTATNDGFVMNLERATEINLDYMRVSDAIDKIVKLCSDNSDVQWEWWVSNAGAVGMGPEQGSDVSGSISFVYGTNIERSLRRTDIRNRIDRILVIGRKQKNTDQDLISSGWIDDGGTIEYEYVYQDNSLESAEACIAKAKILLQEASGKEVKVKANVNDTHATGSWGVGDTITLTNSNTGLSGTYRVVGLQKTYSVSGEQTVIEADARDETEAERMKSLIDKLRGERMSDLYDDDRYEEVRSTPGMLLFYEAERLSLMSNVIIEADYDRSSAEVIKMASAQSGAIFRGPGATLKAGSYRVIFMGKVTSNGSSSNILTLDVYSLTKGSTFASLTITPDAYDSSGVYQAISFTFNLDADYDDIELRANTFQTGITDWYCDWVAVTANFVVDDPPGPPSNPAGLSATGEMATIRVKWTANSETDLDHYVVYRDTSPNPTAEYARVYVNLFIDNDVSYGTTYYYRVTAVDWTGQESSYSNEDSASPQKVSGTDIEPDTITGDLLVEGIQPYECNIDFEAPQAEASAVNPFNIDVNDGAGGCTITASNGTWADFAIGDEIIIANSEDPENDAVNWTTLTKTVSNVTATVLTLNSPITGGTDNTDDEQMIVVAHDKIQWAAATVTFSDGSIHSIDAGSKTGLSNGLHYLYFNTGSSTLQETTTYSNVIGNQVGLLAKIQVSVDEWKPPLIFPFRAKGLNINADAIAVQSIDSILITSEWLIGKRFKTAINVGEAGGPAGWAIDKNYIVGYSGGTTMEVYIQSSDGKLYAAAGDVVLDSNGITINCDSLSPLFFKIGGTTIGFLAAIDDTVDYMELWSTTGYDLSISSGDDLHLLALDDIYINAGGGVDHIYVTGDIDFNDIGSFNQNLRIPAGTSDPASLASGDLWLRTDL